MLSNFTPQDIACASHLTKLTWGDEMALTNNSLKNVLYEAMVRYYYRSEVFSLKMTDEDGMQGFLLAAPLSERDNSQSWLKQSLQHFECEEQDLVYDYLRYLSYNGQKVRALANPEDLLLCLFLSMKSGVGSKLLHNVEAIAQKNGVKKFYLWADATCDYEYYRKRGYSEAAHFTNNILPQLGVQETWIYSKELKE